MNLRTIWYHYHLLIVALACFALALLAGVIAVHAESIEDQILESPNDTAILVAQVFADHNPMVWIEGDLAAFLSTDLPTRDWREVVANGIPVQRWFIFTEDARREAWVYDWDGQHYLFVFGDMLIPGVYEAEPDQPFYIPVPWHGAGDAFILPDILPAPFDRLSL